GSQPHFGGGLAEAPVHGSLYAFPRAGGRRNWVVPLSHQHVLLWRFEGSPLLVCSAPVAENREGPRGRRREAVALNRSETMLIDKRSGKVVVQRDKEAADPFHTLRLLPATGEVELIASGRKLRLTAEPKR